MWWKISIDAWTPIPKWIPPETGGRDVKHYRIDGNWLVIESHIAEVIFRNRNEVHRSEALAAIEASGVVRVEVRDVTWWRDAHVLGLYLTDGDLAEYDTLMAWARERTR